MDFRLGRPVRLGIVALTGILLITLVGCGDDKKPSSSGHSAGLSPEQLTGLLLETYDLPETYRIDINNPTGPGGTNPGNTSVCSTLIDNPADALGDAADAASRAFVADVPHPALRQYIGSYADMARATAAIKQFTDTATGCNGRTEGESGGGTVTYRSNQITFPPEGDQFIAMQIGLEGDFGLSINVVIVRVDNLVTLLVHQSKEPPSTSEFGPIVKRATEKLRSVR